MDVNHSVLRHLCIATPLSIAKVLSELEDGLEKRSEFTQTFIHASLYLFMEKVNNLELDKFPVNFDHAPNARENLMVFLKSQTWKSIFSRLEYANSLYEGDFDGNELAAFVQVSRYFGQVIREIVIELSTVDQVKTIGPLGHHVGVYLSNHLRKEQETGFTGWTIQDGDVPMQVPVMNEQ